MCNTQEEFTQLSTAINPMQICPIHLLEAHVYGCLLRLAEHVRIWTTYGLGSNTISFIFVRAWFWLGLTALRLHCFWYWAESKLRTKVSCAVYVHVREISIFHRVPMYWYRPFQAFQKAQGTKVSMRYLRWEILSRHLKTWLRAVWKWSASGYKDLSRQDCHPVGL